MEAISKDQRDAYFLSFKREALHLEMRDIYVTSVEAEKLQRHLHGEPLDPLEQEQWWRPWIDLMQANVAQGKSIRRLRIISEPVSDYIRFEWMDSDQLLRAGEQLHWLPRARVSALMLPGNDFWLFDEAVVIFTHFSGEGRVVKYELTTHPDIVSQCVSSFNTAWPLGIEHSQYKLA